MPRGTLYVPRKRAKSVLVARIAALVLPEIAVAAVQVVKKNKKIGNFFKKMQKNP